MITVAISASTTHMPNISQARHATGLIQILTASRATAIISDAVIMVADGRAIAYLLPIPACSQCHGPPNIPGSRVSLTK